MPRGLPVASDGRSPSSRQPLRRTSRAIFAGAPPSSAAIGLEPPQELIEWFGWHNAVRAFSTMSGGDGYLLGGGHGPCRTRSPTGTAATRKRTRNGVHSRRRSLERRATRARSQCTATTASARPRYRPEVTRRPNRSTVDTPDHTQALKDSEVGPDRDGRDAQVCTQATDRCIAFKNHQVVDDTTPFDHTDLLRATSRPRYRPALAAQSLECARLPRGTSHAPDLGGPSNRRSSGSEVAK